MKRRNPARSKGKQTLPLAFDITGRVALITGAAGLLGPRHAEALLEAGGIVALNDLRRDALSGAAEPLRRRFGARRILELPADITRPTEVRAMVRRTLDAFGRLDILVNNAANDPKMDGKAPPVTRLDQFPVERWAADLAVGLTGAFLCCQEAGAVMERRRSGTIINVGSELGLIGPDQRVYVRPGQKPGDAPIKPVSYSVVKGGLMAMTRWLATYFAPRGVRVNTLCPATVQAGQPPHLQRALRERIPLGRLSRPDEFGAALVFLASDASSYMTGQSVVVDGGRTIW